MIKAIALKNLWLEEGTFSKGNEFYPGWTHDVSLNPEKRLYHLHPEHRAMELVAQGDISYSEEAENDYDAVNDIDAMRKEAHNVPVFFQLPKPTDSNSDSV